MTSETRWRELTRWLNSDDVREQPDVTTELRRTTHEREQVVAGLQDLLYEQAGWVGPALRPTTR